MRGALFWLNCVDPAQSIEAIREVDSKLHALRAAIGFLHDLFATGPFSVAEIIDVCSWGSTVDDEKGNRETLPGWRGPFERKIPEKEHAKFRELFLQIAGLRGFVNGKRLAHWLKRSEGRRCDGFRIERAERDAHAKVERWRIARD